MAGLIPPLPWFVKETLVVYMIVISFLPALPLFFAHLFVIILELIRTVSKKLFLSFGESYVFLHVFDSFAQTPLIALRSHFLIPTLLYILKGSCYAYCLREFSINSPVLSCLFLSSLKWTPHIRSSPHPPPRSDG